MFAALSLFSFLLFFIAGLFSIVVFAAVLVFAIAFVAVVDSVVLFRFSIYSPPPPHPISILSIQVSQQA